MDKRQSSDPHDDGERKDEKAPASAPHKSRDEERRRPIRNRETEENHVRSK